MTDTVPPSPKPGERPIDPVSTSPTAAQPNQLVTLDMDMIDRVMITHPGLTRETAQQALDAAGY